MTVIRNVTVDELNVLISLKSGDHRCICTVVELSSRKLKYSLGRGKCGNSISPSQGQETIYRLDKVSQEVALMHGTVTCFFTLVLR